MKTASDYKLPGTDGSGEGVPGPFPRDVISGHPWGVIRFCCGLLHWQGRAATAPTGSVVKSIMANKTELVEFLNRRVFDPILRAGTSGRSEHEKKELEEVQEKTRTEQQRFRDYPSAEKVVEMYRSDLHSENAKPVNAKLKRLDLPILADVEDEFMKLAG